MPRRMSVLGKYDPYELVSDDETRTFKAREGSSGRTVLVHQIVAGRTSPNEGDLLQLVLRYLRNASAESLGLIIDMGEHECSMYVVTENIPGFRTLRSWLEAEIAKPAAAGTAFWRPEVLAQPDQTSRPVMGAAPEERNSALQGEVNARPSGGVEPTIRQEPEAAAPLPRVVMAEPTRPEPISAERIPPGQIAGEVTRIFRAWSEESRVRSSEPLGEALSPDLPEVQPDPTRTFHPSHAVAPDSTPLYQEPVSEPLAGTSLTPGEFTSIFGAAPTSSLSGAEINRLEEGQPPIAPAPNAGEFTRLFRGESTGAPMCPPFQQAVELPAPEAIREPGEFTRMFQPQGGLNSPSAEGIRRGPLEAPKPPPAALPSSGGPGEFTRLFGSPSSAAGRPPKMAVHGPQAPPAESADQIFVTPQAIPKPAQEKAPRRAVAPAAIPRPSVSPPPVPKAPAIPKPKLAVQSPPASKSGPSALLLAIILGALSLAAVGLVLFFVLRH